ncbi:MAG: GIY-YIG nuclease family protein [Gammaproteobacteria bacterium]|nr:GIY-YIG nuclease family protein [Gammaproteobacteria bacterium]
MDTEIIYILTNEAMPGLVKVGKTDRNVEHRLRELYNTSIPVPFECFHASVVPKAKNVERRIHRAFDRFRVNQNREFFEIEPEAIAEILAMVELQDATPQDNIVEVSSDISALKRLEERAERFSFKMLDIEPGTVLTLSKDETIHCEVVDNHKVRYSDEVMSLSAAALAALKTIGYEWKAAQGAAHWMYQNRTLKDIRNDLETN